MANTIGTIQSVTKKTLPAPQMPKATQHPHKNLGGYLHAPKGKK